MTFIKEYVLFFKLSVIRNFLFMVQQALQVLAWLLYVWKTLVCLVAFRGLTVKDIYFVDLEVRKRSMMPSVAIYFWVFCTVKCYKSICMADCRKREQNVFCHPYDPAVTFVFACMQ